MQTIILVILILLLLIAIGVVGRRSTPVRLILVALVLALVVLAAIGFVRDEQAVGPGVAPIIEAP
ncbi:hypothetical protein [Ancylobacter rudongensis]|uniref:Uncharacterized protein n=1 Tax=Ancylobacter rudongensis TaxID=177413 RepID=A0A1G4PGD6_9HYPH|nr:hypothetical protein [Ancylobacter rudongensis]SCW31215.1 hypothetical protein SAMN05660859_0537 [Ancylobacter rudongensis]